ncbi:hypothetical protein N7492_007292 [Penicillium capsulatum]|uniref:Uncharacterized protein n=1 Tax=Penicillium capsulatum TaxID=69766 RepID=A0A9W9LL61_9EURO|nr:hypothetical protein N7492_007292 [Penicillium capsulatum]KAJ6117132.1 hypothetical protein N7512_006857 [Penicillium capsulatum]
MKITAVAVTFLLAATATAFDKFLPWGKRDYACVNVYQGIPDNSTVTAGDTIHLRFNRQPTTHCSDALSKYPADKYSVWLYNNPVRNRDTVSWDQSVKVLDGIDGNKGFVDVKIPKNLPQVQDGSVWYLRLSTVLSTAPQVCPILTLFLHDPSDFLSHGTNVGSKKMPSLYNAAGPFTIAA